MFCLRIFRFMLPSCVERLVVSPLTFQTLHADPVDRDDAENVVVLPIKRHEVVRSCVPRISARHARPGAWKGGRKVEAAEAIVS